MTDVAYIAMKTPDGAILGHARVEGGFFTLQLKRPLRGQAVALTDSGSFSGALGSRIAAAGAVQAVAAMEEGRLLCCGLARGADATYEDVRRRVAALQGLQGAPATPAQKTAEAQTEAPAEPARAAATPHPLPVEQAAPAMAQSSEPASPARALEPTPAESAAQAVPAMARSTPQEQNPDEARLREIARQSALTRESVLRREAALARTAPAADAAESSEKYAATNPPREPSPVPERSAATNPPREPSPIPERSAAANPPREPSPVPERSAAVNPPREPSPVPERSATAIPPREPSPAPERSAATERGPAEVFPVAAASRAAPERDPADGAPPAPENSRRLLRFAQAPGEPQARDAAETAAGLPSIADSTADSESFMALLRRADAVFQSLETPQAPLIHAGGQRSAARREGVRVLEDAGAGGGDAPDFSDRPHPAVPAPPHLQAWNEQVEALLTTPAPIAREPLANPFPHIFPGAQFSRLTGNGVMEHLEGDWISGTERCRILAVPGDYSPQPPRHLFGFTRYIRSHIGGFWVKVVPRG